MSIQLTMPKLSPTMESGTIVKWHKKEGDHIEPGDLLIEVATDKATVEHNAIDEGYLRKILVKEGNEAEVNQQIAIVTDTKDESFEEEKEEAPKKEKKSEKKEEGEEEKEKEEEPEKAPASPGMRQPEFAPFPPLEDYEFEHPIEKTSKRVLASPLARKLAEEQGLDLTTVKGSGPGGRIMERDLELAQPLGTVTFGSKGMPKEKPGEYEEIPLSQMRKVISKRLQEAKTFIPHYYVRQQIDAEPLSYLREELKNVGLKVSFNDLIIRAAALALKEHPTVNGCFNTVNNTIVRYKTIDISVAVTLPDGLITPIVRHADYKNVGEIAVEIRSLVKKAKEGSLQPNEYQGGSFTVSNLGMYKITDFQAVINPPQAAILAVGGILDLPVVKDGKVVPGKAMNLSLSADHRVIDGVTAAEFLKTLQKFLENPSTLLL